MKVKFKTEISYFLYTKSVKNCCFCTKFFQTGQSVEYCKNFSKGQSVGGQTEGYNCILLILNLTLMGQSKVTTQYSHTLVKIPHKNLIKKIFLLWS